MHRLLRQLDSFRTIRHPHQLTLLDDSTVAKVTRVSAEARVRTVDVDGVNRWREFHWLDSRDARELGLADGRWLLAIRDFTPGVPLSERDFADEDALNVALQTAYRLRDLHEVGVAHGDVQPGNVVLHRGATWLIDLSPVETRPGEVGHVAGSAPLMAPELWSGGAPEARTDVYALGALLVWLVNGRYPMSAEGLAGWADAHRSGTRSVGDLPGSLGGVVRRTLDPAPESRPTLQTVIDALRDAGAEATLPPTVAGQIETTNLDSIIGPLAAGGRHVQIVGPPLAGKTWTTRRIHSAVASRGVRTVVIDRDARERTSSDGEDPWASVRALVEALCEARGVTPDFPSLGRGDRLHAFAQLTEAVLRATGGESTTIIWDDFETARADTRAWWAHFVDAVQRRGASISTVVATPAEHEAPAIRVELQAPDPQEWNRWRGRTLRTEVRDTSQARWEQLVEDHGDRVGALLRSLDREHGARAAAPRQERRIDTATLISLRAGWADRVENLMQQCAFSEVIETCSTLLRNLTARGKADPATERGLLGAWTEAIIAGGGGAGDDELEAALRDGMDANPGFAILLARLLNSQGRHTDGLEALATFEPPDEYAAEAECWRGQLAISSGNFDEAKAHAEKGLATDRIAPGVRTHLEMLRHAGDALRGEAAALDALDRLAPELETSDAPTMLKARLHAYRAIGLTRLDQLDEATDAYLRALEQIENGGLAAELPTYLLNAGTAYHRQGRLGLAREYYARGLRVAQPSTRASTRALLYANQANVDLALGRLDEARELVARGLDIAEHQGLTNIVVMCRSVRGDIELAGSDPTAASSTYRAILDESEELNLSSAQAAEVRLSLTEAAFQAGDLPAANRWIDEARQLIEAHQLVDLENLHGMLRARLQWAEGSSVGTMAGIELFRRNLLDAHEAGDHRTVLRQAPHLARALEAEGLDELLREVSQVAHDSRNAIAMGLGRELRRDFFANLPTFDVAAEPEGVPDARSRIDPAAPTSSGDVEPFYRMLSLNEVILHADSLDELLPDALEIALSLSHAERGFILLRDEEKSRLGKFRVAASRDVGGEAIPSPHLEVSLTIAEEAARTGRTVVTLNARQDGRFSEALSVVDLDLTSVLCVPIRDGSGLLGALYLDHRFRPGVFEGGVPRMMEAYGHQLALAVTNARRIDELESARHQLSELLEERETMLKGLEQRVGELTDQVEQQRAGASLRSSFPDIAFGSRAMEKVLSQVERVARGDIPVVVTGESGVGKELIARAIHDASPRRSGPFVAFNCGAVSESLFESEMFGHIKGAFTGADVDRQGLFHAASGGTIFLDEIGEMPLSMQVKLLRVLQERQIRRVGEAKSIPVDIRVVAATNRDLMEMVEENDFREDLYYRLAAFVIEIPALRERPDDIPLIASALLEKISEESDRHVRLTAEGARLLMRCSWQGNVRQLENTLRAASVMADSEELGEAELAPLVQLASDTARGVTTSGKATETRGRRLKATRLDVVEALRRANDDREKAAEFLGVSERTMYRYMKRWDLYD